MKLIVGFLASIISNILTFSYTLLSVTRPSRKDYCSIIPIYHGNSKKRFHLKDTTKHFIKTRDIFILLSTDLGNLNNQSLILQHNRLSMYIILYIFLKFTCPIGKKNWNIFPDKNKSIFSKPKAWLVQLKEGSWVTSVKTYSNW